MSPEELKAQARRFADEMLTQGDLFVIAELFTDDCCHHAPEPVAPGASGIASWVAELRHAFPDLRAIVEDEIAAGDRVALRLSLTGTHQGRFRGIAPSGHRAHWQQITILHAGSGGRFIAAWSSWDRLALLAQLDARSNAEDSARAPPDEPHRRIGHQGQIPQCTVKEIGPCTDAQC